MRPLFHPPLEDITVEGILHALSDPIRVRIFADIVDAECPQSCAALLKLSDQNIPKSSLSQHFRVLREAGLIRSERNGVALHNTSRLDEIRGRFDGLIVAIVQAHAAQNERLNRGKSSRKAKKNKQSATQSGS